ncbi:MAG TPA: inorganic pyrophosphatase [Thermoanaerobaculia bacterium]|nr:inorganic pyrophosphatase [Thermoanaerobaculia bacterium]
MAFPPPSYRWRPHPWHGLEVGPDPPSIVTAYIEITPFDAVKYELDKATGYIRVDRPQRSSAQPPTLYGFVPRTYCADRVAELAGSGAERGDGDPLDICVVSERPITRADILLDARVVGGLGMIDGGEADDKIIAVLENDLFWGAIEDLAGLPEKMVERLAHYFSTYKLVPGSGVAPPAARAYGRAHACRVIDAAIADYRDAFEG